MPPPSFHLLGAVTQAPEEDSQGSRPAAGWGSPMCVLGDFMSPDHMQRDQEGGSQSDESGIVCGMRNIFRGPRKRGL